MNKNKTELRETKEEKIKHILEERKKEIEHQLVEIRLTIVLCFVAILVITLVFNSDLLLWLLVIATGIITAIRRNSLEKELIEIKLKELD